MTTEMSVLKAAIGRPWLQSRSIFKGVHDYRHIPILKCNIPFMTKVTFSF